MRFFETGEGRLAVLPGVETETEGVGICCAEGGTISTPSESDEERNSSIVGSGESVTFVTFFNSLVSISKFASFLSALFFVAADFMLIGCFDQVAQWLNKVCWADFFALTLILRAFLLRLSRSNCFIVLCLLMAFRRVLVAQKQFMLFHSTMVQNSLEYEAQDSLQ